MENGNPAARLYNLIQKIRARLGTVDTKTAWCEAFGVDKKSPELFILLGSTMQLLDEAKELVDIHQPALNGMTRFWHNQIYKGLHNQNLLGQIDSFTKHLTDEGVNYLFTATIMLDVSQRDLTTEDLNDIKLKLRALISDIEAEENLEPKVIEYCRNALNNIIHNIDLYFVSGKVPVVESIQTFFGRALVDEDFRKMAHSNIGSKLISSLHAIASLVTVVSPLVEPTMLALGVDLKPSITRD